MQLAIEAQALTKRFRKLHSYRDLVLYPWRQADHLAVDQVSLRIARGELFGLLGQNGAGKTTLIKMLCTALLPSSGSAAVMGYDVVKQSRQVRERIGLVNGEERSFYWRLTGRQNLEFFAALFVLYTILGCLVESLGMIVITVPLLYPVLLKYGIDPVWFGIILVLFIELGQISPPIGINLFVIQSIWDGKLSEIVWGTIPFHLLMFVLLVALVLWPEIALWLPHHMSAPP